jgi:two-component system, NarL family, sensor histidine kinase DevS
MADDVVRHASEERSVDAVAAVRPQDDEVGLLGRRCVHDRFARVTLPDQERGRDAKVLGPSHEGLGRHLAFVADLVDAGSIQTTRQFERARVDHADGDQPRPQACGQAERFLLGRRRRGGQVRREQHGRDRLGAGRHHAVALAVAVRRVGERSMGRIIVSEHGPDPVTCGPQSRAECHHGGSRSGQDVLPVGYARADMDRSARVPHIAGTAEGEDARDLADVQQQTTTGSVAGALAVDTVEALDAATRAITEVLDLEAVLQLIVDRVRDLVDARYAALGIADAAGRIERFITSGLTREERAAIGPLPQGHGLLGLIIREGRSLRIADIASHPDSAGFPPNHPPMRSLLGVPITVAGRPIGDLYLTDKADVGAFGTDDQRVVELFARHAGIAIENARLHDRLAALRVVAERERIGRDLHDGVIQGLYAIGLSLEEVESMVIDQPGEAVVRVDRAIDGIHRSIADIREFILGLRPGLAGGRLADGFIVLADELRLTSTIDVEVDIQAAAELAALDEPTRGELLHLAREALSNIARHSRATRARVDVRSVDDELKLEISDNGVGFDLATITPGRHHGLVNLRQRAGAAGGRLDIDTRPGAGTRLIVHLPAPTEAPPS